MKPGCQGGSRTIAHGTAAASCTLQRLMLPWNFGIVRAGGAVGRCDMNDTVCLDESLETSSNMASAEHVIFSTWPEQNKSFHF